MRAAHRAAERAIVARRARLARRPDTHTLIDTVRRTERRRKTKPVPKIDGRSLARVINIMRAQARLHNLAAALGPTTIHSTGALHFASHHIYFIVALLLLQSVQTQYF